MESRIRNTWLLAISLVLAMPGLGQSQVAELAPPTNLSPDTSNALSPDTSNAVAAESGELLLSLADVIASLLTSYPEIERARLRRAFEQGNQIAAYGSFDTKVEAYSLSEPTGFYRNFRHGLGVARQTWWGGYLSAGFRLGRGDFQPWYKERETNEGGEFKVAMGIPLLQGRAIDANRVAVFQANLGRRAAEPGIQLAILSTARIATETYWEWVASGNRLKAQGTLLNLAIQRQNKFEFGEQAGAFAEVDVLFNRQLVAERQGKLLESQQKFRDSGFKLSLFLRDGAGVPILPDELWLPIRFPVVSDVGAISMQSLDLENLLPAALNRRPEPRLLILETQTLEWDRRLARNQLLPNLDVYAEGSQDTGLRASSSNDKGQFELLFGLKAEVPIQRRKARGTLQKVTAKIADVSEKLRLQQDKIGVEIQSARNAMLTAADVVKQAEAAQIAAIDTMNRYQIAFEKGYADIIYLNLLETKANESTIKLINAQRNWFIALSQMQTALALDPLEQAMNIASLPLATVAMPSSMPENLNMVPENFEEDWKRHANPPSQ